MSDREGIAQKGIYPNRDATSALTMAVERGYNDIVDVIRDEERGRCRGITPDAPDDGATAVWQAFSIGAGERALQRLDEQPALIDQPGPDGHTFLYGPLGYCTSRSSTAYWRVVPRSPIAISPFAMSGAAWHGRGTPERIAAVASSLRRAAGLTPVAAVALGEVEWVR